MYIRIEDEEIPLISHRRISFEHSVLIFVQVISCSKWLAGRHSLKGGDCELQIIQWFLCVSALQLKVLFAILIGSRMHVTNVILNYYSAHRLF